MSKVIGISMNGTKVFEHAEAHPHRIDLAAQAIGMMTIPFAPADDNPENTRVCQTVDLGVVIGVNHLVETNHFDNVVMFDRGRGYKSRMVINREAEPETRVTSVIFWDNEEGHWVLWTNFEGEEGVPEPGSERFKNAPIQQRIEWRKWWDHHALIPTEEERKAMKLRKRWYFSYGELEPFDGFHQPYAEWEEIKGPYGTKKKAEQEFEKYAKPYIEKEDGFVHGPFYKIEPTA